MITLSKSCQNHLKRRCCALYKFIFIKFAVDTVQNVKPVPRYFSRTVSHFWEGDWRICIVCKILCYLFILRFFITGALAKNGTQPQNQKNGDNSKDKNINERQISPLCPGFNQNLTNNIVTKFNDV